MKDGFLNLLKPPGMSSHDMVGIARRVLGVKRIGHAGTLDPGAAGVLPLAVGRAARLIEYLSTVDKSYRAELVFGLATDSGDDTGHIVESRDSFVLPGEDDIKAAMRQLTGEIMQIPSAFSAIKIHGHKACDLARKNIAVDIPPRQVTIYRFELLERRAQNNTLLFDVDCSKGTYIRSLCTDLGKLLGIPAAMSFLLRTRVGAFQLADAYTIEEFQQLHEAALLPPEDYLQHIPRYDLADERIRPFFNGLPTQDRSFSAAEGLLRIFGRKRFLGMGRFCAAEHEIVPEKLYLTQEAGTAL
jgi:tRNA pseudouridine55 synthase